MFTRDTFKIILCYSKGMVERQETHREIFLEVSQVKFTRGERRGTGVTTDSIPTSPQVARRHYEF